MKRIRRVADSGPQSWEGIQQRPHVKVGTHSIRDGKRPGVRAAIGTCRREALPDPARTVFRPGFGLIHFN